MKTQHKHLLQRTYLVLVFGFMYLPIAVLIAYSFNENKSRAVFTGFSLKWYASLFHNEMILSALGLSLVWHLFRLSLPRCWAPWPPSASTL